MPSRVAVVIPAHNAAATLLRAVDSVAASAEHAARTGLDLRTEIVVVDDGSTDATAEKLAACAARFSVPGPIHFKAIHQINRGAGPARNEGVRQSSAPLICFLDADDEYLPAHLAVCVGALEADRSVGYVWTRRRLDIDIHPSWGPSLDRSTVMNLCVRRIWHEIVKGFPEHPDFARYGAEDSFYRTVLEALVNGRGLDAETLLIHFQPGNSLDRQRAKLSRPISEWPGDESAPPTIVALCEERLAYVERLKAERRSG
ncbi:putative Glycosyl transferase, family 2 [uncultured Alphaproteobacteria bacterium]|uniref:Putative Glycosyl transferase, family 2 n=1 Tax=uncultured Alphaproteobacteria bacterium TaxID=91750 RepID=A0A212IWV0_9PROT|nr:putative Glycosyl transferase, family 2 [uncultured Alphaproteobacteria bacterium]